MGDSAPIVLSPLRVAATVGGTSFITTTGNGARTRVKRNASATDGVAIAKPVWTRKRKSPSGKVGTSNKNTCQRKNNTMKTSAVIAVERGYSIPWAPSPTAGKKHASTQTPNYGQESYVAPLSRLQLVINNYVQGNNADTELLGYRCCYVCGQTLC